MYNVNLSSEDQVDAEEAIARLIFEKIQERPIDSNEDSSLNEEECAELGRDILKLVLHKFCPKLVLHKVLYD